MWIPALLPGVLFIVATFLWHLTWDVSTRLWFLPPSQRPIHPEASYVEHLRSAFGIAIIIAIVTLCFSA